MNSGFWWSKILKGKVKIFMDELFTNLVYPAIVVLGTSLLIFIFSVIYKKIKKYIKTRKLDKIENNNNSKETQKVSILIEPKETANIYRATKTNNSYLLLNVMLVNTSNDIIVIRNIEAKMNDIIGIFQQERISVPAINKDMTATYTMSNSKNLLPLSITGNTSIDAFILFVFPNAKIEIGSIQLKVISSKGDITIPLSVDIIS